jgi:hypothetical protein
MSGKPAPSPSVQYIPAPPPPAPPTQVPTQSLTTQVSLDQISAAQQQLNALLGSQLDQTNTDFNTTEAIRQTQATGAENRLTIMTTGEQNRLTQAQAIQGNLALGAQSIGGQIATIGKTAEELRSTNLQQEMFRRYQNNLDYSRAANAYHA